MTEENTEQVVEVDADQLQELLGGSLDDKLPPIEIPFEWYDSDEFHRGLKEASHSAGVITAMLNAGVTEGFILDYLLNKETIKHNLESAKINKEMNIEIAKHTKAALEKQEL